MGDDPHVGFDDLHVDAVLLLSDDHRPPQPDVLPLLLGAVGGDRLTRVARATPAGRAGFWYQNNTHPLLPERRRGRSDEVTASRRSLGRLDSILDSILTFFFSIFAFTSRYQMSKCVSGGFCSSCTSGGGAKLARTFPVRLVVRVVQVVPLVRRVKLVHVDVEVVWRLPEVVLALVQRQADSRGGELFTLTWTSLQG